MRRGDSTSGLAAVSRGSTMHEPVTRGSSRGLPVPAPPASKRELLKAKRKLLFKCNVFEGERFYLDLDGYSNTNQLETDLYEMGALVERFFNNQVTKIITNKKEGNHNRNNSASSSLSKLSSTRAAALLNKSISSGKNSNKTSVQEKAKKMGIKILQLKVIVDIVAKEKEKFSRPEDLLDETKSCPTSAPRSRKLKAPYIKVEDSSCSYRPVCSNFTKMPLVDLSNIKPLTNISKESTEPNPGIDKENRKSNQNRLSVPKLCVESTMKDSKTKDEARSKMTKRAQPQKPKNGYCEICDTFYSDLKSHVKSQAHEKIVVQGEYWSSLDSVINALPTLDSIIKNIARDETVKSDHESKSRKSSPVNEDSTCNSVKPRCVIGAIQNYCDKSVFCAVDKNNDNINKGNVSKENYRSEGTRTDLVTPHCQMLTQRKETGSMSSIQSEVQVRSSSKSGQKMDTQENFLDDVPKCSNELNCEDSCEAWKQHTDIPGMDAKVPDGVDKNFDSQVAEGGKCYTGESVQSEVRRNSATEGNTYHPTTEYLNKDAATLSEVIYGPDSLVAKEIEDRLETLLKFADTVTQQQKRAFANEPLPEKNQTIQSRKDISGAVELSCISGQIVSNCDITIGSKKLKGKVDLKKANTREQSNSCANYKDTSSQTKHIGMEKDGMIATEELNIHSNTTKVQNRDDENVETLEIVNGNYKTSEIVNENYIFSSLSLVDNEYIDNKTLSEFNQDSLNMLSEITEKYAGYMADDKNSFPEQKEDLKSLPYDDKPIDLNDVFGETHSFLSNQLMSSKVIIEENVLPVDQYYVKTALDKVQVMGNESPDFSEISTNDEGLPCDTYQTIIQTLDLSEPSANPDVPFGDKKINDVKVDSKHTLQLKTEQSSSDTGSQVSEMSSAKSQPVGIDETRVNDEIFNAENCVDSESLVPKVDHLEENCLGTTTEKRPHSEPDTVNLLSEESCNSSAYTNTDHEATLCYGSSSGCESSTPTKTKKSESSICTSETEARDFLTRSSLPYSEDACDGIGDFSSVYDEPANDNRRHTNLLNKPDCFETKQSLSRGYHSLSPRENSIEYLRAPTALEGGSASQAPCKSNTQKPVSRNLPKPNLRQRATIKLRINLKKKQCNVVADDKNQDLTTKDILENNNYVDVKRTPKGDTRTDNNPGMWIATPPTGLKLKLSKVQESPVAGLSVGKIKSTGTPVRDLQSSMNTNDWSVHRSGDLKLKFSASKLAQKTDSKRPVTAIESSVRKLERSPPSQDVTRPNKRRRKLTYEPGTLKW